MVHLKGYMYKWIMQDLGKKSISYHSIDSAYRRTRDEFTVTPRFPSFLHR